MGSKMRMRMGRYQIRILITKSEGGFNMIEVKEEKIKEIFRKYYHGDTDWSITADRFIEWNVDKNFQTQSFKAFVEWIDDSQIGKLWHFFFGYGDNYELFANDWIEDEEKEDYLNYCLSQQ